MSLNRREFLALGSAFAAAGCSTVRSQSAGPILFGVCTGPQNAEILKKVGYDYWEWGASGAFVPDEGEEKWKRVRDQILSAPIPLRCSNGFIPGRFRLTGPKADHAPALDYAERVLRRAEEVGVKAVVFGSGGARNVPGDMLGPSNQLPDTELGASQFADFCRELCRRVADLKTVQVVIEPLRPKESNIVNYVWQSLQICRDVNSPRLAQLADFFHMMMGGESAESVVHAGSLLRHCHVASYKTRSFPGSDPETVCRLKPYFNALKEIGYSGGISCECGWGRREDFAKNLETALNTLKGLVS